jgi:hypothetical protein
MKILVLISISAAIAFAANDVEVVPWKTPKPPNPGFPSVPTLQTRKWSSKVPSTGRAYSAFMAWTDDGSLFSFVMPENGCVTRNTPSDTAK